jgi:dipeptidase
MFRYLQQILFLCGNIHQKNDISMRKQRILTASIAFFTACGSVWACTNLLVGRKASTDGSVIISYTADSHGLYGEMYRWKAAKWDKGAMLDVYEWDSGKPLGQIAQAAETYSVVGNMNEYQVAITETTFGGRRELRDSTGILDYGSLIYIALQRSRSAREAIKVMTGLVAEYGYYSGGESFSIADKNEVWIMEMIGKGVGNKGAVWVAIRIPDDCIAGHANQSRIQQIPFSDKENCLYSPDVVSFARSKGYYSGDDKDFSFAKAYNPYDFGGLRACEARVWSFFRKYDTAMERYVDFIKGDASQEPMPLYIKPSRQLSVRDVQQNLRDHYEGTALDMTQDAGAGPFKAPYRWRPMNYKVDGTEYFHERPIATQQTGFVIVAQMRNWLPDVVGGIAWFGCDDAAMVVFNPVYSSSLDVPECYRVGNGDLLTFSWTSAFWVHNWVANMVYNRYSDMITDVRKLQNEIEGGYETTLPAIEKAALELYAKSPDEARQFLTWYSCTNADEVTARWKQFGEFLTVKYLDGIVKKEENGTFKRNRYGQAERPTTPGYDTEFYREIVKSAGERLKVVD